jgi:WD40 repeat protein/DNA-binding SARP family transcriptional activator
MLEVRLLGRFDVRLHDQPVEIASRPGQSLLAFLVLNAGTAHRRERLAGLFWPDVPEPSARRNLRYALWRIRKALEAVHPPEGTAQPAAQPYIIADDISIVFNAAADYWLDVSALEKKSGQDCSPDDLIGAVSVYGGDLLPGFYDEWIVLERERLQAVFEQKMRRLLECLVQGKSWEAVLECAERWIALGHTPEPAYRALMEAHAGRGDLSAVASTYRRCQEALLRDLGVEPSAETRAAFERLMKGEAASAVDAAAVPSPSPAEADTPTPAGLTPEPGEAPFMGLHYFDEVDADLFFGREKLTARLVERLCASGHLLAVVGASGSGKSSLVRAGLVPALKHRAPQGGAPEEGVPRGAAISVHILTPTARPLEALAVCLTRETESVLPTATLMDDLARDPRSLRLALLRMLDRTGARRAVLVVDQFEELFTLCQDEAERKAFVANLLTAAPGGDGSATGVPAADIPVTPVSIVITLRADFYAACAQYESLREALSRNQEYIGPMNAEEMRRAILEPAQHGLWTFEPGLVEQILRDAGADSVDANANGAGAVSMGQVEPGALPLLSHALLETWKRRRGRVLTLAGYAQSGGVRGAIAHTAERVYQQLTLEQQQIARRLFLRMTQFGAEADAGYARDTRRRATLAELVPEREPQDNTGTVLNMLADARLVTTAEGTAEVAHEALIREWPRLREWLAEDRDSLRLHRHFTETALAWKALERDRGELYRGARLAQAVEWAGTHAVELNELERAFLDASRAEAQREEAEREADRQRQLEAARKLAEAEARRAGEQARAARQLRRLALFLAVALVAAGTLAFAAVLFGRQASLNALQAQAQTRVANARDWAAAALTNLSADPERSILLALQAVQETYATDKTALPEALDALHQAVPASRVRLTLLGHTASVQRIVFSPDGTRLATISQDTTVRLWDAATGHLESTLTVNVSAGTDVAFSPDGTRLVTAGQDGSVGTVKVWDVASGQQLLTLGDGSTTSTSSLIARVTFSPDGKRLATAGSDGVTTLWDAATGRAMITITQRMADGETPKMSSGVAFSPDGLRLATASKYSVLPDFAGTGKVWDVATGRELLTLTGHTSGINAITYSPDGTRLATAGNDATARLWDAASGQLLHTFIGHTAEVVDIVFSPDGSRLATASLDRTAKVWDVATGRELMTLSGHTSGVTSVAFSPTDGGLSGGRPTGGRPSDRRLRLATASQDGTARVWDISPSSESSELLTLAGPGSKVNGVTFSPDGTRVAAASQAGMSIWDATTGQVLYTERSPVRADADLLDLVSSVVYSPDGTRLATIDLDRNVRIRDARTGKALLALPGPAGGMIGGATALAFSPDGTRLATASADLTAKVWDAGTGQELFTLYGHSAGINTIAFSPDGARLVTGSSDGMVKVWDAATSLSLLTLTGHGDSVWSAVFSPRGNQLATGSRDGTVKIWDAITGQLVRTLAVHAEVRSLAYSPDGALLATGNGDRVATLWDAASGDPLFSLQGHTDLVSGVAFSPDGTRLATSSYDGTVRLYVLRVEDLVSLARARVTRALTPEECRTFLHLDRCP